jgi:hypothetical protein
MGRYSGQYVIRVAVDGRVQYLTPSLGLTRLEHAMARWDQKALAEADLQRLRDGGKYAHASMAVRQLK